MAVIGTFGSFTAARLGIYASQASLNVTGNNIANINTKGYTRQRLDLVSIHGSGNSRYANGLGVNIGYGVLADGASQLRDPFLDIRYRDENSKVGAAEARVDGLQQLAHILDEVGKGNNKFGVIEAQFSDLLQQLNILNRTVGSEDNDTIVRSSAQTLVRLMNDYAKAMETTKNNQLEDLKGDVKTVNTLLTRIRDLNAEIRKAGIFGDDALELRDQRNVFIDELSSYMKIDVKYETERIDQYSEVEKLVITLADSGNPPTKLVDGIYATQLDMPEQDFLRNPAYDPADPKGMQYLDRDGKPTDSLREAAKDATGKPTMNPDYDATHEPGMKYLDENGDPTDDPAKAEMVDNAKEGSDENRLWMRLAALTDKEGRYMRDEFNQEITETVDLGDNDLFGSLQAVRELLTEEGEFASETDVAFDPKATDKRGIPYYQKALDALARKFAETFNQSNQVDLDKVGKYYEVNADGEFVNGATPPGTITGTKADGTQGPLTADDFDTAKIFDALKADPANQDLSDNELRQMAKDQAYKNLETLRKNGQLTKEYEYYDGGPLFSNSGDGNDTTGITAANISISKSWSVHDVRILNSKEPNEVLADGSVVEHTTANDNIGHLISMMGTKLDYYAWDVVPDAEADGRYFSGTFQEMLASVNNNLATDQLITNTMYSSYTTNALALENNRQSVSGVDLNEEATSMMQYQKSYAAACQLMTTLDSMLDKLINGTIR